MGSSTYPHSPAQPHSHSHPHPHSQPLLPTVAGPSSAKPSHPNSNSNSNPIRSRSQQHLHHHPSSIPIPAPASFITPHTAYFDRYPPRQPTLGLGIQPEPVPALSRSPASSARSRPSARSVGRASSVDQDCDLGLPSGSLLQSQSHHSSSSLRSHSNSLAKKLSKLSLKSKRSHSATTLKPDQTPHSPDHALPPSLSRLLELPISPPPPIPTPSALPCRPPSPSSSLCSADSYSLQPCHAPNPPIPLRSSLIRPSSSPSTNPRPSSPPIHSALSRSFSLNPLPIAPSTYHSLYPFPIPSSPPSQADNASLRSSSESSIGDLFAGPRSSLQYDPSSSLLRSPPNHISHIDALIDTFNHPPPSPELSDNHPHRLYKSRSKPILKPHSSPAPSTSSIRTIHTPCQASLKQPSFDLALGPATFHSDHSLHDLDLPTGQPTNTQPLPDSDSARSGSSSSHYHRFRKPSPLAPQPPPPPNPHPRSALPMPIRIPTIDEIVQRHAILLKNPPRKSSIPINGLPAKPAARSIDEIVDAYMPLLQPQSQQRRRPSGSDTLGSAAVPLQTRRRASDSSECSDGSINSVTREAMRHLKLDSRLADSLDLPRTGTMAHAVAHEPQPAPRARAKPATETAEEDLEMARYLRSPRLTTLLQLERQPSRMTVSLADVGAPAGHPVIVFLGLGCVRYLVGLYDELAEALGLRLVCIDRWGLGKTSTVADEERGFLEWAGVVEEVADQLGLGQFSILAHSAGAPYALATSLRLGTRVRGSIHLLAPWVSMSAEGGVNAGNYRWLKYVPNSMIRTAQAAEWKVQGWRLGKPPALNREPVGYDVRAPVPSAERDKHREPARANGWGSDCERPSVEGGVRPSLESRISDWSRLSSETKGTGTGGGGGGGGGTGMRGQGSPKGLLGKVFAGSQTGRAESVANSEESSRLGAVGGLKTKRSTPSISRSMGSGKSSGGGEEAGRRRVMTNGGKASGEGVGGRSRGGVPGALLGVSLLRASYAESLKGGTSELMAILERGAKPWGFSYADVVAGVKVWHGSKDERISLRCAEWVCEVVGGKGELVVVEGVGHSLLMEVKVVVEVLESICEDWKS